MNIKKEQNIRNLVREQ